MKTTSHELTKSTPDWVISVTVALQKVRRQNHQPSLLYIKKALAMSQPMAAKPLR
jgi:hypothetical protein